jgi:hypothetical protein
MNITVAIINDHTNLGGPMGSEYTAEITRRYFADDVVGRVNILDIRTKSSREKAMAWVCKWISTNKPEFNFPAKWEKMSFSAKLKVLADTGSFGVVFEKEKVY